MYVFLILLIMQSRHQKIKLTKRNQELRKVKRLILKYPRSAARKTHNKVSHNTYIHTYINTHIYTCIHTYIHTFVHTTFLNAFLAVTKDGKQKKKKQRVKKNTGSGKSKSAETVVSSTKEATRYKAVTLTYRNNNTCIQTYINRYVRTYLYKYLPHTYIYT